MKHTVNVLTLEHRTDRQKSIVKQSEQQGFDIRWFKGERAEERKDIPRAICMGHKRIIRYAKENDLPFVIVAEDDCVFTAPGAFRYFMGNMPKDFNLYIGVVYSGEILENRVINGMSGSNTLIIVNKNFYDVVLNDIPDTGHVDRELGNLSHRYKYYVCPKVVCYQLNSYSDHMKRNMNYDRYLDGKIIYGKG